MGEFKNLVTSRLLHRDLYNWEIELVEYFNAYGVPTNLVLDQTLRLSFRIIVDWIESMVGTDSLTFQEKTVIKGMYNQGKNPKEIAIHIMACRQLDTYRANNPQK